MYVQYMGCLESYNIYLYIDTEVIWVICFDVCL